MISALVLTKNEEINIEACLRSLAWCDEVIVFDSFSDDRTVEIAKKCGAQVLQHPFVNYGQQREAARTLPKFANDWIFSIDADERVEPELAQEILRVISSAPKEVAYRVRRKDYFLGQWIKHSSLYPSWFVRLYRRDEVRFGDRAVHEYPEFEGSCGELEHHLIHDSFSKGVGDWWEKHIKYAKLEAIEAKKELGKALKFEALLSKDPVVRRRMLKRLSYHLPARPALRFFYMYLLRGGILDGSAGYEYCQMLSAYERLISVLMKEP